MPKASILRCASICMLLLSASAIATVAEYGVTIALPDNAVKALPYYAVRIPLALYPLSANSQLSDLRIRNAKGDLVNYAWLDGTTSALKMSSHGLPFFPLLASTKDTSENRETFTLDVKRQADGSLTAVSKFKATTNATPAVDAWIIDASKLVPAVRLVQARVRIDPQYQGIASLRIEASEDIKHWYSVGGIEQLVQLQHQGEQIQKLSLPLGHSKARYLRLVWAQAQTAPQILAIDVDTQEQESIAPSMQWTDPIKAQRCDANSCEYKVPANTPIDSLRLHLQEKNTLAKVQIVGELATMQQQSTAHRHFRNPLYVLRHQKQKSADASTQGIFLADVTAYRLDLPQGEASTEDISLSGDAFNKIRLQIPSGIKSLGALAPTISFGSLSRHLAFLARGDAPYRIEFDHNTKAGAALDVHTLMPNINLRETALAFAEMKISKSAIDQATLDSSPAKTPTPDKLESTQKRYWLWAAIIAALAIMAAMVWSLLRNIDRAK